MGFKQTGNISQNARIQGLVVTEKYVSVTPIIKIQILENFHKMVC
jgi:hypothetical protein